MGQRARGDAADAAIRPRRRHRRSLGRDLTALGLIGVLLAGAFGAAAAVLYDDLYSPAAFVRRYLDLLSRGDAASALAVPGVAVDSAALLSAGLPADAWRSGARFSVFTGQVFEEN